MADQGTPEWWRDRLLTHLAERSKAVALHESYYDGNHPLPTPPAAMAGYAEARQAFESLSRLGVTNYVRLVADAPAERLRVVGFRFGDAAATRDDDGSAWRIWQRNHLDADSGSLHHQCFVSGSAAVMVWPEAGQATITVEHPGQVIVAYEPGSFRRRAAALKVWTDEEIDERRVVLYRPDAIYKWSGRDPGLLGVEGQLERWQPPTDSSWPIANPLGVVPIIEFRANPSLRPMPFGGGRSEFAGVLPIQDRINKTVFDRLVTAEFQAFRQRWAVGWTPADGNQAIQASMRRLLTFPDPDTKVGEFQQAQFSDFIAAVEADVQAMAAITRTPSFYTLGSISNISGDTLKALQAGLIAKTEGHRDQFSESWEEVLGVALRIEGSPLAGDTSTMVLWADIEHRTWAETADATLKMQALGVPREALWSMLPNVTPQDIDRWRVMEADQALFAPQPPLPSPLLNAAAGPG